MRGYASVVTQCHASVSECAYDQACTSSFVYAFAEAHAFAAAEAFVAHCDCADAEAWTFGSPDLASGVFTEAEAIASAAECACGTHAYPAPPLWLHPSTTVPKPQHWLEQRPAVRARLTHESTC